MLTSDVTRRITIALVWGLCILYAAQTEIRDGIDRDGLHYAYGAISLATDGTYYRYGGDIDHFTPDAPKGVINATWPPLYSAILVPFVPHVEIGMKAINAVCLLLTLIGLWCIFEAMHITPLWRGAGVAMFVLSPVLVMYRLPLTEAITLTLITWWFATLPIIHTRRGFLAWLVIVTALPVIRYASVIFIPLSAAILLWRNRNIIQASLFAALPILLLTAWFARNYALTETIMGYRTDGRPALAVLSAYQYTVGRWSWLIIGIIIAVLTFRYLRRRFF